MLTRKIDERQIDALGAVDGDADCILREGGVWLGQLLELGLQDMRKVVACEEDGMLGAAEALGDERGVEDLLAERSLLYFLLGDAVRVFLKAQRDLAPPGAVLADETDLQGPCVYWNGCIQSARGATIAAAKKALFLTSVGHRVQVPDALGRAMPEMASMTELLPDD